MAEGLDYAGSGVDIDLEGNAVGALVGALSRSVRKPWNAWGTCRFTRRIWRTC